ncbi:MAG: ribosome maturation factor RimM [bacterium]
MTKRICIGAIAGAHGVKGEIKVKSFTAHPADIAAYGPLTSEDQTHQFTLKLVRQIKPDLFIARAKEIANRDAAEQLKSVRLYVDRDKLPAPDKDEFYYEDLVGLIAITETGAPLGKVKAVVNHGAGDILELTDVPEQNGGLLIPFTRAAVPEVNLAAGFVTIAHWPERFAEEEAEK